MAKLAANPDTDFTVRRHAVYGTDAVELLTNRIARLTARRLKKSTMKRPLKTVR
jgi:hypothetical protein